MGRPTTYTEDLAFDLCDRIACGESLASICRQVDMPPMRTVMGWLRVQPAFQQQYARAREEQGDADADAVADIRERMLAGEIDPNAARVAIDSLKWSAGKRKPKKYGDKLALVGGGPGDGPIQTVDLSKVSDDDLKRLEHVLGALAHPGAGGSPAGTDQDGTGEAEG